MRVLKRYAKLPIFVIGLFFYVSALQILAISTHVDPDLFFLINGGREVLDKRHVPHMLFNTIHDGFHTIMQQWLTCVMDAAAYNIAGFLGVKIIAGICYLIITTFLYLFIRDNVKNDSFRFLALSLALLPVGYYMNGRPWEISICIACAFIYFSNRYSKSGNWKWLIAWPLLSLLSANFHSVLWIVLICFGFTYVCPGLMTFKTVSTIKRDLIPELKEKKTAGLFYLLMLPMAFLNPNGAENLTYLFNSYNKISTEAQLTISEVAKPAVLSISGVCALISILFIGYYIKVHWTDCNWQVVYLAAGTVILEMTHVRNMWIGSIGALPLICEVLNDWDTEDDIEIKTDSKLLKALLFISEKITSKGLISVIAVALITVITALGIFTIRGGAEEKDSTFSPVLAADYLDGQSEDVVLFTGFNNGAYLAFRGYNVYMHAQPELYEKVINGKKDVYEEFQELMTDPDYDFAGFIDSYGFNYLCIEKNTYLYQYVKYNSDYEFVVDTDEYVLAKRIK